MAINFEKILITYKVNLLEEFEQICKDITDEKWNLQKQGIDVKEIQQDADGSIAIQSDYEYRSLKIKGQLAANILMLIDRVNNTSTVALLAPTYEKAFSLFGLSGYDYYDLPINRLFSETRSYHEKWEEIKNTLINIIEKTQPSLTEKKEPILEYLKEQVAQMSDIEEKYQKQSHNK